MKKSLVALVLLMVVASLPAADKRFGLSLTGGVMLPADTDFQEVYGKTVVLPELQLGYQVKGPVYVFVAGAMSMVKGTVPGLGDEARADQQMASLGAGLTLPLAGKLALAVQAGGCYFHVKEEAFSEEYSTSVFGFRGDVLLALPLSKSFYAGAQAGYRTAAGENDRDPDNKVSFTLGGFTAGVTLGVTF